MSNWGEAGHGERITGTDGRGVGPFGPRRTVRVAVVASQAGERWISLPPPVQVASSETMAGRLNRTTTGWPSDSYSGPVTPRLVCEGRSFRVIPLGEG